MRVSVSVRSLPRSVRALTALMLLLVAAPAAHASISDDFADGDDSTPPWSHFAPTAGASFDASTFAYLIAVPATANPLDPARAASLREDASFRDVIASVDLIAYDGVSDHGYGVVARSTSAAAPARDGYAFAVRAAGEIALVQIDDGVVTTLASQSIGLSGGVDYKLVLTIAGSAPALLTGELYALTDLANRLDGIVREISPVADPATRTYQVKVTLRNPPEQMRFGASVVGRLKTETAAVVVLPGSALFDKDGKPAVWVVDAAKGSVALKNVVVARYETDRVVIGEGLQKGDIVVTAGVNRLREGQKVRLAEGASK